MTTDTLAGSGTYTVADGTYAITVRRWGGGASGGGTINITGANGGGGGCGEFISDTFAVVPGQQFAYACGAGGTPATNAVGHDGGDTAFGALSPAHGGKGGKTNSGASALGGLGGTGGTGDIQRDGAQGGSGQPNSNGGGGAAPGDADHPAVAGAGKPGATGPVSTGGNGGDSGTPSGTAGTVPGAGGGGAYSPTAAYRASSAGAAGSIEVEYTSTVANEPSLDAGTAGVTTGGPALSRLVTIPSGAAVQSGGSTRQWIAPGADVLALYGSDPATTGQFFDNADGFLIGTNPSANPAISGGGTGLALNAQLGFNTVAASEDFSQAAASGEAAGAELAAHWDAKGYGQYPGWANVALTGSSLKISAVYSGGAWTGGMLEGTRLGSFAPPYFAECRARAPAVYGMWPAPGWTWSAPNGTVAGVEVDFAELLGRMPTQVPETIHGATAPWTKNASITGDITGWHTYAAAVWPDRTDFYIDGTLVTTIANSEVPGGGVDRTAEADLCISFKAGGWAGTPTDTSTQVMEVDYIRAWTYGGAPPGQVALDGTPVLKYVSYAQFAADVAAGAIDTQVYSWVLYDPEFSPGWGTPLAEAEDPWAYARSFVTLAHQQGFSAILAPGRDLGNCPTSRHPKNAGEDLNAWYLRTGVATACAQAAPEVYEVQDQANTLARQGRWGMFANPGDMGFGSRQDAFAAWETWTGRKLRATSFYLYSIPGAITSDLQWCADHGVSVYLSMHPAVGGSAADLAALDTFLADCKAHGLVADVALYHEPANNGLTSTQYINCVKFYNGTIRKYYPVAFWCSARSCAQQGEDAYYPGNAECDLVIANIYCSTYLSAGIRLDQVAGIADAGSKPLGIGEYNGNPASQTQPQITTFYQYVRDFMEARTAAGKPNAPSLLFCSNGNSPDPNTSAITSAGDFRVALWEDQYDHAWQAGTFVSFFNSALGQARAARAAQKVWCGISANYGEAADMLYAAESVDADGYWVNTVGDLVTSGAFLDLAAGMPARPGGGTIAPGVLVAILCGSSIAATGPFTAAGFTAVTPASGTNAICQLLYRITDGSEGWVPGTSQVTVAATVSHPFNCHVLSCSSSDADGPLDPVPSVSGQVNGATQVVSVAGITTAEAPDRGIWLGGTSGTPGGGDAPPAITVPAGWTGVGSQVNSTDTGSTTNVGTRLAVRDLPASGAQGAANGSIAGGVNKYTFGIFLALRPAPVPAPPPEASLCGAFISLDAEPDEAAGIAAFTAMTGRALGVRVHSYAQGVIPADYATDLPGGGPPPANTVTVTNPGSRSGNVGTPVSLQLAGTDSDPAEHLTWTATGLPAGLAVSTGGLITGSPTAAQTRTVTVTATDSTGAYGSALFSWVINPPVVVTGYGYGGACVNNVATGDAAIAAWEAAMSRPLRERMYFQVGSFPSNYSSLPWAGDKNVPRRMHVDVEPATDGSQVAAFKAFLAACKNAGADVTFRIYHSCATKFSSAAAFKTAFSFYGPLVKQYGFRLHLSAVAYNIQRDKFTTSWVPSGVQFDAFETEWYASGYTWGDRLDKVAAIADYMGVPLGLAEYGANIGATVGNDIHVDEATGINYFRYTRDFMAARITAHKGIAECLAWNSSSGAGVTTPGYVITNQPASWVTWQQRIYDLVTRSSPGNPYIW